MARGFDFPSFLTEHKGNPRTLCRVAERSPHLTLVQPAAKTQLAERPDDELVLRARAGNDEAFNELVRRYQPRVLRIAARYLGSSAAAADVAQTTFLELFRALPRYRSEGRFFAYLYQILANQCRMASRGRHSRDRTASAVAEEVKTPVEMPDEQILAAERAREVERALATLSPKLRDVLLLRFAGQLSYLEIAGTLDLPLGTVKRRLFDGIEKLRVAAEEGARS
jgi:RNA polymerase sigma-70 factor (ECF subfamily)